MKTYYVYVLSSQKNGTLYIGFTNNLIQRAYLHKSDQVKGFTRKYGVHNLVYFEQYNEANEAIAREKRLKKWKRSWKIELIEKTNPDWKDLYPNLI